MKKYKIIVSETAEQDLENIILYLKNDLSGDIIADKYKILFEKSEKLASRASLFSKLAAGLTLSALFALVIVLFCVMIKAITRTIRRAAVIHRAAQGKKG